MERRNSSVQQFMAVLLAICMNLSLASWSCGLLTGRKFVRDDAGSAR